MADVTLSDGLKAILAGDRLDVSGEELQEWVALTNALLAMAKDVGLEVV